MKKLFWEDPYLTSNTTLIENVNGRDITLKETVFYAFSGGQESDTGTIADIPVERAEKKGNDIVYTLSESHNLVPGAQVTVSIDWERRYSLMRLHFAAEIILFLITSHFPEMEKIGAHISESKSRLDFYRETPITPILTEIEEEANTIISKDMPVISDFSNQKTEKRYWEIPGFGSIPCGGTHIRSTGEIGRIKLSRKNIGKGKERVEIVLA